MPPGRIPGMTVMPTLCAPDLARAVDRGLGGAVLWRVELRQAGEHVVLPDLSPDLVWTGRWPEPVPRTTSRLALSAVRGTGAVGLRLPIAVDGIGLDRSWPGWAVDDPDDREERLARLTLAVAEGAVTWRIGEDRHRLIRALDRPGVRITQVAAECWAAERTVRRTCRSWFGASPGEVAQILRVWRFARAAQGTSLADAAVAAGYADQSHASREVRALTGLRPRELAGWAEAGGPAGWTAAAGERLPADFT